MTEVKDAYQEYIEQKNKKEEEEGPPEDPKDRDVTPHMGVRDVYVLLDLIRENKYRYSEKDRQKLDRVERRLRVSLSV